MLVTKADGTVEEFDPGKLRRSLKRAGASNKEVSLIVQEIQSVAHEGMRTGEIYRRAFDILKRTQPTVIARYALRRAVFDLGPTGFPFETFLSRLFQAQGYKTRTGLVIRGKCATHEIDVAAYKKDHSFVAEAKFHARPGLKSDLQVAMYSYARLLDLSEMKVCNEDICGIKNLKIITNTKFTTAAIKYAECVGVEVLGWDYPSNENLYSLIEKNKLYPITVLQSISTTQKRVLIEKGVILCSDILEQYKKVEELGLSNRKLEALLFEARQLSSAS